MICQKFVIFISHKQSTTVPLLTICLRSHGRSVRSFLLSSIFVLSFLVRGPVYVSPTRLESRQRRRRRGDVLLGFCQVRELHDRGLLHGGAWGHCWMFRSSKNQERRVYIEVDAVRAGVASDQLLFFQESVCNVSLVFSRSQNFHVDWQVVMQTSERFNKVCNCICSKDNGLSDMVDILSMFLYISKVWVRIILVCRRHYLFSPPSQRVLDGTPAVPNYWSFWLFQIH